MPEDFRTTIEPENGGTLIYPRGDRSAPPSGHMPKGGFFFDSIIRQKPLDLENLNPEDNMEQYTLLTDKQLDEIEEDARAIDTGEYAVFASLTNTSLGDIALIPGPDLPDPKGVRDIAEWYMLTASRPDVVHKIYQRAGRGRHRQPGKNPFAGRRRDRRPVSLRNRFRDADFELLLSEDFRQPMEAALRRNL